MSKTTPYSPKPGSVAYRVIGWLETQPQGAEFNSSTIAEALGIEAQTISPSMDAPLRFGAVFCRRRDRMHPRAPVYWSLVDHEAARGPTPPAPPAAEPAPAAPAPAANEFLPPPMAAPAQAKAASDWEPEPATQAPAVEQVKAFVSSRKPPKAPPVAGQVGPRVAIWSDGTLQIDQGGQVDTYAPSVGLAMLDYLELRQRVARAAGAAA